MIDKKLAKEIGATHFILNDDHSVGLYRISSAHVMLWNESEFWEVYLGDNFYQAERIDFTEPETVVEYEKVTDSIFDLRDAFEAGELYNKTSIGGFNKLGHLQSLVQSLHAQACYRKVEKPVDWKEVAREFVKDSEYLNLNMTIRDLINPADIGDDWRAMADKEVIKFIKRIYPLVK